MVSPSSSAPSAWQREPYRVLFPVGFLLVWTGIGHWLLTGLGWISGTDSVFHSIAQIQGFMFCFAGGFLLTAIPRRTGTPPPAKWQVVLAATAPVATTLFAWFGMPGASQAFWYALVIVLLTFAIGRFRTLHAKRRPPDSFVWIPCALLMGVGGSLLMAAYGALGEAYFHLHELGKLFLLQGMFLGLVFGVGGMALPLLTCGDAPSDGTKESAPFRGMHLLAALALIGTFFVQEYRELNIGYTLRAAISLMVLVGGCRIHRLPSKPGLHRWLVWLAAWMIPIGYTVGALDPIHHQAGLHIVFIGGFALLAFTVGLHVALAHGGYEELVHGRPWQVVLFGVLILAAVWCRAQMDFDGPEFRNLWQVRAAGAFLSATVFWGLLVLPRIFRVRGSPR